MLLYLIFFFRGLDIMSGRLVVGKGREGNTSVFFLFYFAYYSRVSSYLG
jgi:hypothetical protein